MKSICKKYKKRLKEFKELVLKFEKELKRIEIDGLVKNKDGEDIKELQEKVLKEERNIRKDFKELFLTSVEQAETILGKKDVIGPADQEKTWNVKLEKVPPIPFSKERLEKAKELGQYLILRIDKDERGKPLSMKEMNRLQAQAYTDAGGGNLLENEDWYKDESFFTTETPKLEWALVSKETIPDSKNKNYLEQTETIIDYLKNEVFEGKTIPDEYKEAIKEFNSKKAGIQKNLEKGGSWEKAAEALEKLKITKLTRQTPSEVLFDGISHYLKNREKLLESEDTWTSRRNSGGELVLVGGADADGMVVGRWRPGSRSGDLGVSVSCSV